MKASLLAKLDHLHQRYEEVGALLSTPEIIGDGDRFRDLSREYAQLEPLARDLTAYRETETALRAAREMLRDPDPEVRTLAEDEVAELGDALDRHDARLMAHLIPSDPNDARNIFLEIRAGTGGSEAALFAGDLFRMYQRYADSRGWGVEVLSLSEGEQGGYREIIARVAGRGAYSRLKFESGAHRVQRVPVTEAQGRIHTSAATVAVLPELDEAEAVDINPADLRVDTYRASGAGGQHVNKTDSAIRITHLPSGIVVECQDERSQHKNRARAMSLLAAKLLEGERSRQAAAQSATRKLLVGSGDRSERIRTYNFPQGRITDHRVNLTVYKLEAVLAGDLDPVIEPLMQEYQAEQLADLAHD